jgi:hypothetical protein
MTQDLANELYLGFNEPPKRIDYVFVGDHYGLSVDIARPTRPAI